MIPVTECYGCRDDFYNGRENIGGERRCWSAKTGKMMTRYRIYYLTAPTEKGAYTKVRKPSCYHTPNSYVYENELPSFVRASDLNRERRAVR